MANNKLTNKEIWKDIPNYEGLYQVSNLGKVKSLRSNKILTNSLEKHGYYRVGLTKNKKLTTRKIHQLVAEAFLNHKPNGYEKVIDHIDNNKINNNIENIQIVSNRYNASKDRKGTSKYTGVNWDKSRKKWLVKIYVDGRHYNLGRYKNERVASAVYKHKLEVVNS